MKTHPNALGKFEIDGLQKYRLFSAQKVLFNPMFPELSTFPLFLGILAAFLVGVTKTGIPGLSMVIVPLMAITFPAKSSVGTLLLLLLVGDIFAIAYYRKFSELRQIFRLIP